MGGSGMGGSTTPITYAPYTPAGAIQPANAAYRWPFNGTTASTNATASRGGINLSTYGGTSGTAYNANATNLQLMTTSGTYKVNAITATGAMTSGTNTLTLTSAPGVQVGMGVAIPTGLGTNYLMTYVTAVGGAGETITLESPCTATVTAQTVTFFPLSAPAAASGSGFTIVDFLSPNSSLGSQPAAGCIWGIGNGQGTVAADVVAGLSIDASGFFQFNVSNGSAFSMIKLPHNFSSMSTTDIQMVACTYTNNGGASNNDMRLSTCLIKNFATASNGGVVWRTEEISNAGLIQALIPTGTTSVSTSATLANSRGITTNPALLTFYDRSVWQSPLTGNNELYLAQQGSESSNW